MVRRGHAGDARDPEGVSGGTALSEPLWYFAYGSNMSPAVFLGRRAMRPIATRLARLDGYRLCFDIPIGTSNRGVANVERCDGAHVWGVAYQLDAAEFDRLDRTEGVHRGLYARLAVEFVADGDRIAAFTYRSPFRSDARKPSARYLGLLLEGARHHGLPAEYVAALGALELAIDERSNEPVPAKVD